MARPSRRQLLKTGGGLISTLGIAGCLRLTSQTATTESSSTGTPDIATEPPSTDASNTTTERTSVDLEQYWEVEETHTQAYIPEKCGIACRDVVYVSGGSDSTQIKAFDLLDGEELWSFQPDGDRVGVTDLTADQTNLYATVGLYDSGGGYVLSLDRKTGEKVWSTNENFSTIRTELILSENRLVVTESTRPESKLKTKVTIIDVESGEKETEIDSIFGDNSSELHGVATTSEKLYISANNNLHSYSFATSELVNIVQNAANTGPVVDPHENVIYQPTQQSLTRIDPTTGSLDWEADVRTVVKPAIDGNELICGSASGVTSISASDGGINWLNANESVTPGRFDLEDRYIWYTPDDERTGHLIDSNGGSIEYTFSGSVISMDSNFQQYGVVATMDRLVGYKFDW